MAKRKAVGEFEPLAASVGAAVEPVPARRKRKPETGGRWVRYALHVDPALLERIKDAIAFLHRSDPRVSMAAFSDAAWRRELERLQRAANEGKPFPRRKGGGALPGGRRPLAER